MTTQTIVSQRRQREWPAHEALVEFKANQEISMGCTYIIDTIGMTLTKRKRTPLLLMPD